jgi:hypothetical protein
VKISDLGFWMREGVASDGWRVARNPQLSWISVKARRCEDGEVRKWKLFWVVGVFVGLWPEFGERVWAENDPAGIVYGVRPRDVLSKEATEGQEERKKGARTDLDLESSMREKGYFWVNGGWIKKGQPVLPARHAGELKDSDGDGFDDFTEIKFHTDPFDAKSTPASYFRAKGSNQVTFYGTNATAHKK